VPLIGAERGLRIAPCLSVINKHKPPKAREKRENEKENKNYNKIASLRAEIVELSLPHVFPDIMRNTTGIQVI
jgi:hypothetical protein